MERKRQPSPRPEQDIKELEFTGPMAAVVVGFFENKSHAHQLQRLGVTPLDPELIEGAYDLAETLPHSVNRAKLRHDALLRLNQLTQASPEELRVWLLKQPEEARDVIDELIQYAAGMINDKHTLDEVIKIAHMESLVPTPKY